MLKNTFGAGVVEKLVAADQPLLHGNLAPGAEEVREFFESDVRGG